METLIVLLAIVALAAFGVKYRLPIERWLRGPNRDYARRKKELRRCIEDDQDELARIEKAEAKAETGEK